MNDVRRQLVVFDRQDLIKKWHDRLIPPGADWRDQIDDRLAHSDIILLFVSPDFFESDYCYEAEMAEAMRRHRAGSARVIPIILRPCAWQTAPFADLQVLPRDGRPITTWPNRDEACLDVAEGVMRAVREIRGESITDRPPALRTGDGTRTIVVRVHRAYFSGQREECHFVNLTNLSSSRTLRLHTFGTRMRRTIFRSSSIRGLCQCVSNLISPGKLGLNHRGCHYGTETMRCPDSAQDFRPARSSAQCPIPRCPQWDSFPEARYPDMLIDSLAVASRRTPGHTGHPSR
jgi:TIR domain